MEPITQEDGPRARRRRELDTRIVATARQHLATEGAAGLSLRAVARDVGLASSAVYRYVESREELLTRLIETAYDELADEVDSALSSHEGEDLGQLFLVVASAVRRWGLARPHDYSLIYGSPVPGFEADPDRTGGAGTRVVLRLVRERSASARGAYRDSYDPAALAAAKEWLDEPELNASGLAPEVLLDLLDAWTLLIGSTSRDVFRQLGPTPDDAALFRSTAMLAAGIFAGRG